MEYDEVETLVKLLELVAVLDKTNPDPENPKVGWSTDIQLRNIEDLVVVSMNDPAGYSNICSRTLEEIAGFGMQEISVLLQLAMFNGSRRISPDPEREKALTQTAEELQIAISALPEGTRKTRCQSLLDYHAGVFYNTYGDYKLAAEAQGRGALEAERIGDEPNAAIGYFMQVFYDLKHMLCIGRSANELFSHFVILELKFHELTEALRGTPLQVQWAEHNGPAHMIQACVWLNLGHTKWDEWVKITLAAAEKRDCESGSGLIRALDLVKRGDHNAEAALNAVINQENDNERKATAQLVLIRRALAVGEVDKAKALVASMPTQGAQHVRAIAEKLLAD